MQKLIVIILVLLCHSGFAQQEKKKPATKTTTKVKAKTLVQPQQKKQQPKIAVATKSNTKVVSAKAIKSTTKKTILVKQATNNKNKPVSKLENKNIAKVKDEKKLTIAKKQPTSKTSYKKSCHLLEPKENAKTIVVAKPKKQAVVKPTVRHIPVKKVVSAESIVLGYPLLQQDASIKEHFGIINIGNSRYNNQSVTFSALLESDVYCCIDSAVVTEVYEDAENLYTVFLKKGSYTIALSNLASVSVDEKDILCKNDVIGFLAEDESDPSNACLEMMLFQHNNILNPEKYFVKEAFQANALGVFTAKKP